MSPLAGRPPGRFSSPPPAMKLRPALALSGAALALVAGCGPDVDAASKPRRVVLITVDTLRYDAWSPGSMPRTRAFFDGGQVFEKCYSATSTTQPTHASLFTGLHPWEHGVVRNGLVLNEEVDTLAEHYSALGFHTSAVTSSFPVKAEMGFDQGFDRYDDDLETSYSGGKDEKDSPFYSLAPHTVDRAMAALDGAPEGDQFLWVHLFDPHDPYGDTGAGDPDAPVCMLHYLELMGANSHKDFEHWLGVTIQQYQADVRSMDAELGALLDRLDAESDRYDTLVALTADHGESLGEDGSLGHGTRLHSAQVHVPLAIRGRGWEPGVRSDVAGTVDLTETLLAWAGGATGTTSGRDLAGRADGATAFGMRRIPAEEKFETRVGGKSYDQHELRFYVADAERILCGSEAGVVVADAPDAPLGTDAAPIQALFQRFAQELATSSAQEAGGEGVKKALSALGY